MMHEARAHESDPQAGGGTPDSDKPAAPGAPTPPIRRAPRTPVGLAIGIGLLVVYAGVGLYGVANFGPMLDDQAALPWVRGAIALAALLALAVAGLSLRLTRATFRWVHGLLWVLLPLSFYLFLNLQIESYNPGGGLAIGAFGLAGILFTRPLVAALRRVDVMQYYCPERVVAWERSGDGRPLRDVDGNPSTPPAAPAGALLRILVPAPHIDGHEGEPTARAQGDAAASPKAASGRSRRRTPPRTSGKKARPNEILPDTRVSSSRGNEWLESITIALIMALIIRTFALEAFKIPTGSMKPAWEGDAFIEVAAAGPDGTRSVPQLVRSGDKILVNKFAYLFNEPARWDIIVFKYPLNTKRNFIKRLIGLPNEEVLFFEGDVWTRSVDDNGQPVGDGEWTLARKPRDVQDAMWVRYYTTHHASPEAQQTVPMSARTQPNWLADIQPLAIDLGPSMHHAERAGGAADWVHIDGTYVSDDPRHVLEAPMRAGNRVRWPASRRATGWRVDDAGSGFVAEPRGDEFEAIGFQPFITDRFQLPRSQDEFLTYDQESDRAQLMGFRGTPRQAGDIRVEANVAFEAPESRFRITLHRNVEVLVVEVGADGDARMYLRDIQTDAVVQPPMGLAERLAEFGKRIAPGRPVRLAVSNGDRVARVHIDGVPVFEWKYPPAGPVPHPDGPHGGYLEPDGVTTFSLAAAGGALAVTDVQVHRDVHYLPEGIATHADPRVPVLGNNFFVLGDNTTNSKDSRLWFVQTLTVVTADGEAFEVLAEPDPAPDTQSSHTPFLNPPPPLAYRPSQIDPGSLQRRLQSLWLSDHGHGLTQAEMSQPDVERSEWRARLSVRFSPDEFAQLAQRYRLEPSSAYTMRDGTLAVPMVSIEDIHGVVHRVPLDAIDAVAIHAAPLVSRDLLIGRALMRFWPDNLGFIR